MNKDRIDIEYKWVWDDYGDNFKILQDETHEIIMPMKSDGNS